MNTARPDPDRALYTISVAAELAGVSPRTLRLYEDHGILAPNRTQGGARRYSDNDIARVRRIAELSGQGVNLIGIKHIIDLQDENTRLRETDSAGSGQDHHFAARRPGNPSGGAPRPPTAAD